MCSGQPPIEVPDRDAPSATSIGESDRKSRPKTPRDYDTTSDRTNYQDKRPKIWSVHELPIVHAV